MSSPLHLQIENLATLIAALVPQTDASAEFTRIPGDLTMEQEPPVRHRAFEVRVDDTGGVTRERFGTSHRQVLATIVVEVAYDALHDQPTLVQQITEDHEQIVSLCEAGSSRVSASVQQITHTSTRTERVGTSQGEFLRRALTFDCLYIVAT